MQINALDNFFVQQKSPQKEVQKEHGGCDNYYNNTGMDWLDEFWVLVNGGKEYADDIGIDISNLNFDRWSFSPDALFFTPIDFNEIYNNRGKGGGLTSMISGAMNCVQNANSEAIKKEFI